MTNEEIIEGLTAAGLFALSGPAEISTMFFEMLADAESRYGPRDTSWVFGGINFTSSAAGPAIRVPRDERKIAVLCLTVDAFHDDAIRRWQLAHEIIHLLGPGLPEITTVFEEGLASYEQYRTSVRGYTGVGLFSANYQGAFDLVRPLVEAHANGVRALRAEFSQLSPLQPDWIMKHFPGTEEERAMRLAQTFPRCPSVTP
ncbi:MAG: hypothetical protein QOG72_2629 [Sphingomonadales bacterium]|nr:hypothetical protein [Sphingomonadales bacterium]